MKKIKLSIFIATTILLFSLVLQADPTTQFLPDDLSFVKIGKTTRNDFHKSFRTPDLVESNTDYYKEKTREYPLAIQYKNDVIQAIHYTYFEDTGSRSKLPLFEKVKGEFKDITQSQPLGIHGQLMKYQHKSEKVFITLKLRSTIYDIYEVVIGDWK